MKKQILILSLSIVLAGGLLGAFAFRSVNRNSGAYSYRQFSTIESVVPGGLGRSRIIETDDKGAEVEKEMNNFFSMVGINFANVATNDNLIVNKINEYTNQGWELFQVTTGTAITSNNGNSGQGIFITRYLFRKAG